MKLENDADDDEIDFNPSPAPTKNSKVNGVFANIASDLDLSAKATE